MEQGEYGGIRFTSAFHVGNPKEVQIYKLSRIQIDIAFGDKVNPIEQEMNENMSCIYCSIIYENSNKLRNHQLRCQLNPEYENRMNIYKSTEGYKNRKIRNQFTKAEELGVIKPIVTQETREKIKAL